MFKVRNKKKLGLRDLLITNRVRPTKPPIPVPPDQWTYLGPVVQSVVSLTSSLRVISLTILADSIYNILIFFADKNVSSFYTAKATHIFSAKKISIFAYHLM